MSKTEGWLARGLADARKEAKRWPVLMSRVREATSEFSLRRIRIEAERARKARRNAPG